MKKVIKIENDQVSLASSDFNDVKVFDKKYFNFEPRLNDYVKIYGSGDDLIIGLANDQTSQSFNQSKSTSNTQDGSVLLLIAFIFNVIATVLISWTLIPLAWMIPMTIHSWRLYKGTRENTMTFGICSLLFMGVISGVLSLIDLSHNKQIIDPKIFIKDNKSNIDGIEKKENLMGINKDSSNERLDDILRQMSEAGVSDTFGTKKEIRALPNILSNDEIVKFATSGLVDGNTVLCICTDKRVLFIDKGLIYGITSTEIPLDMINGVSYKKGLLLGSISITNGAKTSIIENVTKADTIKMADTIKLTSEQFKQSLRENTSNVAPIQPDSSLDDLPKLKKLLDDGTLTQEEFDAKKKQILGI